MINLKDETQKEIVKDIIRTNEVYTKYFKGDDLIKIRCMAKIQSLLTILCYSKGIDLGAEKRLSRYISKNIYENSYI